MTTRKVTNRLNLAILLTGLAWRVSFADISTAALGLAGVAVGLAILFVPFAVRWVGAGDVKLLAAVGAWLGPFDAALAGLFGLAGGGIIAVALTVMGGARLRREVAATITTSVMTMTAPIAPRRARALVVPLAVPIAAAAIGIFLARGY
jgi:prepilin peptidase CpaA